MALDSIVIDNTVFNFFLKISDIDLSNILRNTITGKVYVPSQIFNEMSDIQKKYPNYLHKIEKLKNQITENYFFIHCHTYDSVVLEFSKKNIDMGEAEAISQCVKRKIPYFITDDFKCLPFILKNYNHIKIYSSFFLIAIADLHGLINNYNMVFKEYNKISSYNKMNSSKQKLHQDRIENEYKKAAQIYSISISNELLVDKTNILTLRN